MFLRTKNILLLSTILFAGFTSVYSQNISADLLASESTTDDFCAKARACIVIVSGFVKTFAFSSAISSLEKQSVQNPEREYTISFGRTADDSIVATAPKPGNVSNGVLPEITNAFADLHNHPKNTVPSSGDVYGLLMKNKRSANYQLRFISNSNQILYALCVADTLKAREFLKRYPPQQTPGYSPLFPDKLLDEYRELIQRHKIPEEMVMVHMLEKYKTGIVLLKQDSSAVFQPLRTIVKGSSDQLQATRNNCE